MVTTYNAREWYEMSIESIKQAIISSSIISRKVVQRYIQQCEMIFPCSGAVLCNYTNRFFGLPGAVCCSPSQADGFISSFSSHHVLLFSWDKKTTTTTTLTDCLGMKALAFKLKNNYYGFNFQGIETFKLPSGQGSINSSLQIEESVESGYRCQFRLRSKCIEIA